MVLGRSEFGGSLAEENHQTAGPISGTSHQCSANLGLLLLAQVFQPPSGVSVEADNGITKASLGLLALGQGRVTPAAFRDRQNVQDVGTAP